VRSKSELILRYLKLKSPKVVSYRELGYIFFNRPKMPRHNIQHYIYEARKLINPDREQIVCVSGEGYIYRIK